MRGRRVSGGGKSVSGEKEDEVEGLALEDEEGTVKEGLEGGAEESEAWRAERRGERRGVVCSDVAIGGR